MHPIFQSLQQIRIIPVVEIQNAVDAPALAQALLGAGLGCVEITFRTPAAIEAIRLMSRHPQLLVGAGTVLHIEQAQAAFKAGASFMVAPGFNPKVVRFCLDQKIPIIPGIATPTEIEMALEYELEVLKFFPAEPLGGLNMLQAMSAPYPHVQFIPTGGIHPQNLLDYLKCPKVLACGGSWMVKSHLIAEKQFDAIERLSREALSLA